jgi:hypothetical protein
MPCGATQRWPFLVQTYLSFGQATVSTSPPWRGIEIADEFSRLAPSN